MKNIKFLLAIAGLATSLSSQAGVIQTDALGGWAQINAFEPVAQSFVAQDSAIKFAFDYLAVNTHYANTPLRISLLSGSGAGGQALATKTFSLASNFSGLYDIDFSQVALTAGQSYTAVLMIPDDSPYWAVRSSSTNYQGGKGYYAGNLVTGYDWTFRVTPVAPSGNVPEPASLALLGAGLFALGTAVRKGRNKG